MGGAATYDWALRACLLALTAVQALSYFEKPTFDSPWGQGRLGKGEARACVGKILDIF